LRACREGKVSTVEGDHLDIAFDSVCNHSHTPRALELVASTRARLEGAAIRMMAPR
ncbi:LamB/YcsF family protein, partial [Pseudomonas aeruginosa]